MRRTLTAILAFGPLMVALAQRGPGLAPGTPVEIQLLEPLSSETVKSGQIVGFKVVTPVRVENATVVPAGTVVSGEVVDAKAAGAWQRSGDLGLVLKPVRLSDGTLVQLDFARPKPLSTKKENTVTSIAMAPILTYYFPTIPFVLFNSVRHGKPYEIRAGERYRVYVVSSSASSNQ